MSVNPKDVEAQTKGKVRLDLLEPAANRVTAEALASGADKYGVENYLTVPIAFRVYLAAIQRHLDALKALEDLDPDSGVHHMGHILANGHVFMAALEAGTLVDDRGPGALVDGDDGFLGELEDNEGVPCIDFCPDGPNNRCETLCDEPAAPMGLTEVTEALRKHNAAVARWLEWKNQHIGYSFPVSPMFASNVQRSMAEMDEPAPFATCPASHDEIEEFWKDAGRPEEAPSTPTFKPGDRVRVTAPGAFHGDAGVVVEPRTSSVSVLFYAHQGGPYMFGPEELELVVFTVGDRVKAPLRLGNPLGTVTGDRVVLGKQAVRFDDQPPYGFSTLVDVGLLEVVA